MTTLPNSAADPAAATSTPNADPAVDPDLAALAALVRHETPPVNGGPAAFDASPTEATVVAPVAPEPVAAAAVAPVAPVVAVAAPEPVVAPVVETVPAPVPVVVTAVADEDIDAVARPRRGRSLALRFGASFAIGILLALGIGAGALYAWGQQYDGRVLPGVRIGDTDLGGMTRAQAELAIAQAYGGLGQGQITLKDPDGRTTTIGYADVGRGPDTRALTEAALAAGREGHPLATLIGAPQAAIHGVTLESAVTYDRDKLAAAVKAVAASIDQTPADASLSVGEGGDFSVTPSKDGRAVDQAALIAALDQHLGSLGAPPAIEVDVPVASETPAVTTATVEAAKAAADRMTADVVLARGEDTWTIPSSSLRPLVSFATAADGSITPVFDDAGLDPILKALTKKVNQTAKDATLKMVRGRIVALGTSREGRTLRAAGTKAAILAEIASRQSGAAAQPVAAVVKAVDPKLTTADAKRYAGKMKVISSYSVYYWVIINNHWGGNIEAPATKINGTVVPAGETFDFWKVVGDLRKLPGAGPGNAIENGKITVTGAFGGGICTTSTTLFNAAFRAGMIPGARQNHNEFIDRYPAGLDATVWIVGNTKQTMSFKNDTKYPILITRTVTQAGNKRWLTFKIWSVPNGRRATVTNTVIKHGPRAIDTTVNDPTKPVGYRYRNNAPADGAKVWVTVSIYDHGKLHWRKRYFSNYPAVNGVVIVGTKKV